MLSKVLKANARKSLMNSFVASQAARSFRTSQIAANKFNIYVDGKPVEVSFQIHLEFNAASPSSSKKYNITKSRLALYLTTFAILYRSMVPTLFIRRARRLVSRSPDSATTNASLLLEIAACASLRSKVHPSL